MMIEKRNPVKTVLIYVLLIVLTVVTLLPLVWMLSASFKLSTEVFTFPIKWIPETFHWENYVTIWQKINLATYTFNSFKLSIIITLIQLATSSFAAYGFSKCKFPGRNALFLAYIATIAIPWQVYMLPQYIMMQKMHLIDTHLSIILLQSFTAFGVFLLRQFYISIPDELLEAARIDGLSEYGTFARIVLPLTKPAMATLTIMSFVTVWNDYMGPMIYFNSDRNKTIQLGIQMFTGIYSTEYGLIMATSVLAIIPVLVVFLAFQRFFVEGIASSGLKG